MRHIIYKITYLPHVKNNTAPFFYIGSKYNYNGNYYGSLSSKQKAWYSEGLSVKDWWKQLKKSDLKFEIIEEYSNISTSELVEKERNFQLELNVMGENYFNFSIANAGFVSCKKTDEFKKEKSIKTKQLWDDGIYEINREKLIKFNLATKSALMTERWASGQMASAASNRDNSSFRTEEFKNKMSNIKSIAIEYKGEIYKGWTNLYEMTGVSKHLYKKYYCNGFDPEPNIGVKYSKNLQWKKLNEKNSNIG